GPPLLRADVVGRCCCAACRRGGAGRQGAASWLYLLEPALGLPGDLRHRRGRTRRPEETLVADASITVEVLVGASGRFACKNRSRGGGHAGREDTHSAGRRRDASGRPARNAPGTGEAPGCAALSLPVLRAQPGVLPRR